MTETFSESPPQLLITEANVRKYMDGQGDSEGLHAFVIVLWHQEVQFGVVKKLDVRAVSPVPSETESEKEHSLSDIVKAKYGSNTHRATFVCIGNVYTFIFISTKKKLNALIS